ncbi:glycosyltransferase family 2 protein [Anaerovorax odorimutans]|uniref:Glycosyltransferase family 2 protein n=1 Tax=Anaerovorax odorimutans TaxID=109327 RepID=A0ABT1RJB3_9FIRM|nr:glycosyltransferase family 2 protein [Anaerovorax odorimutans]MCQ4635273.1 glycosyltransferase family 2 protein [Anaerovorax odorimutans]
MNTTNKKQLLSIIIPCYNEEEVIELFYEKLKLCLMTLDNTEFDYEIIFVNDGSKDQTLQKLQGLAIRDSSVKYISFSRNFGKESAMLAALEYTSADCVVIMDADLQHPPELIPQMLSLYEQGYDQVIAKRSRTGDSKRSTFFARLYYKIVNKAVDVQMVDGAGDFRLLSRPAVNAVISLKETNRFSKGIFSWIGFKQTYIEYENQVRVSGETKWSFKRLLSYGIDGIMSFNVQPLRICLYAGGILLTISILYLIYLFISILINGIDVPGYFTTVLLISILSGVQLISLGVIGEYVGRIYAEVKKRPAYIVQESNIKGEAAVNNDKFKN